MNESLYPAMNCVVDLNKGTDKLMTCGMCKGSGQGEPSGVCGCGDSVEGHQNPMDAGHSPVEMFLARDGCGGSGKVSYSILAPVLDHGFVRLVDHMGSDLSVSRAARVSYDAAWRAGEDQGSDNRLINYLWANKHTTPFESVTFTFEVKAPIFVFRQWHRHRTWSFNELSARYRELPEEFYVPKPEDVGVQAVNNKQGRIISDEPATDVRYSVAMARQSMSGSFATYKALLAIGWPRELARSVLPVATYSHMFATVNLLNLLKFLTLRDDPHAQMEIRVYAQAMKELVRPIVPVCLAAWEKGKGTENAS